MKITLTTDEKLSMVYEALTTDLPYFRDYGICISYDRTKYREAQEALTYNKKNNETVCVEDVWLELIKTVGITFCDIDEGIDNVDFNMALINNNSKWEKIPLNIIDSFVSENYDANDADILMQYLLYGEVVFG